MKMKKAAKIAFLSILLSNFLAVGALAQTEIPVSLIGGFRAYRTLMSWKEIRDKDVVKQRFDYSCGSGALATLMNIAFSQRVSEDEIIQLIFDDKSPLEIENIAKNGYSLLDLKKAAESKGYITAMYRLQIHHLYQLKGPVLIYFEPEGEKHFAVLKTVKDDKVYLADPARGNIRVPIYLFRKEWPGIILAIDR
jgi:predicted double-glycine peptidase